MGCVGSSSASKPTAREVNFLTKGTQLFSQFANVKSRMLQERISLYIKFNMRKFIPPALACNAGASISVPQQPSPTQQVEHQQLTLRVPGTSMAVKSNNNTPAVSVNSATTVGASGGDFNLEQKSTSTLTFYQQQCLIDDFKFLDKDTEYSHISETFRIYSNLKKNDQNITSVCRRYICAIEDQLKEITEISQSVGYLLQSIIAFKADYKKRPGFPTIEELQTLAKNTAILLDILRSSKDNLTQISLISIIPNTCDSLVNSTSKGFGNNAHNQPSESHNQKSQLLNKINPQNNLQVRNQPAIPSGS